MMSTADARVSGNSISEQILNIFRGAFFSALAACIENAEGNNITLTCKKFPATVVVCCLNACYTDYGLQTVRILPVCLSPEEQSRPSL